jgi:hypothetical protein
MERRLLPRVIIPVIRWQIKFIKAYDLRIADISVFNKLTWLNVQQAENIRLIFVSIPWAFRNASYDLPR